MSRSATPHEQTKKTARLNAEREERRKAGKPFNYKNMKKAYRFRQRGAKAVPDWFTNLYNRKVDFINRGERHE